MIKAVFLDMDGTVISHKQGKVLESTKDAICQLRERGIKVFAAREAYTGDGRTSGKGNFI